MGDNGKISDMTEVGQGIGCQLKLRADSSLFKPQAPSASQCFNRLIEAHKTEASR